MGNEVNTMKINWNSPAWQSTLHMAKILGYLFVSGGLSNLVNNLGQFHWSATVLLIVTGGINSILAWLVKHYSILLDTQIKNQQPL